LEKYTEKQQLLDAVKDVEAVIVRSDIIDGEVINAAEKLKIVVRAGAGYDNIDLDAATKAGICVMNTPGQNANAVAELAFGLMIYGIRNFYNGTSGTELKGKRLGIHAYGNTGKNVARIAKGFDMQVSTFDSYVDAAKVKADGVTPVSTVEELYKNSDFISINIPLTPETKQIIGKNLLNLLPEGAVIVNTARKEVINEPEMLEYMLQHPKFKYLTDITPDSDSEFKAKVGDRYFATAKKMGAQTAEANVNAGIAAANQIVDYLLHGNERFRVNK
jgi:D-3-phosphoglycerate dehydrogenase